MYISVLDYAVKEHWGSDSGGGLLAAITLDGVPENLALLADASPVVLGLIRSFAAGAVVASLGTEVFPKAFKEEGYTVGVATALDLVFAILLSQLG